MIEYFKESTKKGKSIDWFNFKNEKKIDDEKENYIIKSKNFYEVYIEKKIFGKYASLIDAVKILHKLVRIYFTSNFIDFYFPKFKYIWKIFFQSY